MSKRNLFIRALQWGGLIFSPTNLANLIPNLRLVIFVTLIIVFLALEPEGAQSPLAQSPQLFQGLAFLILNKQTQGGRQWQPGGPGRRTPARLMNA